MITFHAIKFLWAFVLASPTAKMEYWYTQSKGDVKLAVVLESFQITGKKIEATSESWRVQEDEIIKDELTLKAFNNASFGPESFTYKLMARGKIIQTITASVSNNKLSAEITDEKKKVSNVKNVPLRKDTIWSSMFAPWLAKQQSDFKSGIWRPKQVRTFSVVFEDSAENKFKPSVGDVVAASSNVFSVNLNGIKFLWTLDENGQPKQIENLSHGTIMKRVEKAQAKLFLPEASIP